jgi:hypothetical protein
MLTQEFHPFSQTHIHDVRAFPAELQGLLNASCILISVEQGEPAEAIAQTLPRRNVGMRYNW